MPTKEPAKVRPELVAAFDLARSLTPDEIPIFLGELETIRMIAHARLLSPPVAATPEQNLGIKQVARRMKVSNSYIYHHWKRLPFAKKEGSKLLFSSTGLDRHLRQKQRQ